MSLRTQKTCHVPKDLGSLKACSLVGLSKNSHLVSQPPKTAVLSKQGFLPMLSAVSFSSSPLPPSLWKSHLGWRFSTHVTKLFTLQIQTFLHCRFYFWFIPTILARKKKKRERPERCASPICIVYLPSN